MWKVIDFVIAPIIAFVPTYRVIITFYNIFIEFIGNSLNIRMIKTLSLNEILVD